VGCVRWRTVYNCSAKWGHEGTYDRFLKLLHIRLDADGEIKVVFRSIDRSPMPATRAASGPAKSPPPTPRRATTPSFRPLARRMQQQVAFNRCRSKPTPSGAQGY